MTRRFRTGGHLAALILALVIGLTGCSGEAFTASGTQTQSSEDLAGGTYTVHLDKAQGAATQSIELENGEDATLEATVTLAVGKGTFKIELFGASEKVTMTLEATDGQTLEGSGTMVADSFGAAQYRVTATDAENVTYQIEYTYS